MIQVIHRAFDILEFLAKEPERPKALGEIASALRLNSATCANILKTMVDRGYVRQEAPKKGYTLGLGWRGLAQVDLRYVRVMDAAEPAMTRLAASVHETVLVAVIEGIRRFNLCTVEGDSALQVRRDILTSDDIYRAATGRLLLAHLSDSRLNSFIARKGLPNEADWPEGHTEPGLRDALAAVRAEGRVVLHTRTDLMAVAFPLRKDDAVVAALGLYLPAFRFAGEHRDVVLVGMQEAAGEITRALSAHQGDIA